MFLSTFPACFFVWLYFELDSGLCVARQDWRIHVDQMHQHRDGIKSSLKEAKVRSLTKGSRQRFKRGAAEMDSFEKSKESEYEQDMSPLKNDRRFHPVLCPRPQSYLDKLQEDIGKTLEKVSSREKYINNQLENLIQEYRSAQAKLSEVNNIRLSVRQKKKMSRQTDGRKKVCLSVRNFFFFLTDKQTDEKKSVCLSVKKKKKFRPEQMPPNNQVRPSL